MSDSIVSREHCSSPSSSSLSDSYFLKSYPAFSFFLATFDFSNLSRGFSLELFHCYLYFRRFSKHSFIDSYLQNYFLDCYHLFLSLYDGPETLSYDSQMEISSLLKYSLRKLNHYLAETETMIEKNLERLNKFDSKIKDLLKEIKKKEELEASTGEAVIKQ